MGLRGRGFAAYFPGSRQHNFKAIVAYGAYKRLRAVEPSSEDVEATNGLTGSTALQGWEDEGDATPWPAPTRTA